MSTQSTLTPEKKPIKVTISGDAGVGKSSLAQLIAGFLRVLGHDAVVVEKVHGERTIVPESSSAVKAKDFRESRVVKIEVKDAEVKAAK